MQWGLFANRPWKLMVNIILSSLSHQGKCNYQYIVVQTTKRGQLSMKCKPCSILTLLGRVNNIPTMQFFTEIPWQNYMLYILTECVLDFHNNVLRNIHKQALMLEHPKINHEKCRDHSAFPTTTPHFQQPLHIFSETLLYCQKPACALFCGLNQAYILTVPLWAKRWQIIPYRMKIYRIYLSDPAQISQIHEIER